MRIFLKKFLDEDFCEIDVKEGTTGEDLCRAYKGKSTYPLVGALYNNHMVHLTEKVKEMDKVQLLDMRSPSAVHIYQHSVILVFLKAAADLLGNAAEFKVCNPVNNGIHIRPRYGNDRLLWGVEKIRNRMEEIISLDLPIKKLEEENTYELDGYVDKSYDFLLPSTGYIYSFELVKYYNGFLLRYPRTDTPGGLPKNKDDNKLLKAFHEADKWESLMGIEYISDLNEAVLSDKIGQLIQVSEAIHEKNIVEIAKDITAKQKRIILIAGPSSSGKTSFANRLAIQLRVNGLKPIAFSTDDYFIDREKMKPDKNGKINFEGLDALDVELFNRDMNDLLACRTVDIPNFNFITGKKEFGQRITKLTSDQPIIIEGIHGLNQKLTEDIDDENKYRIYISPLTSLNIDLHNIVSTSDQRMLRRMIRDYRTRGKSAQVTISDWPKVRGGEDVNIFPYINEADVFFNSVFIYGMAVLKKHAQPLLQQVTVDMPEYPEAERLLKVLSLFETCHEEKMILNNSIIREFIGGSIFFPGE